MSITSLVRPIFRKRYKCLLRSEQCADDEQRALLLSMVRQAQHTEWGC